MSTLELSSMTVIELRKLAKEKGVKLGAGISKSGIVARLAAAMGEEDAPQKDAPVQPTVSEPAPAEDSLAEAAAAPTSTEPAVTAPADPLEDAPEARPAAPAEVKPAASAQPQYKPAWRAPAAQPRYSARPAYQASPYSQRAAWQSRTPAPRPSMTSDAPRTTQTVRPAGYTPRFGPDAQEPSVPSRQADEYRAYRSEPMRTPYGQDRLNAEPRPYEQPSSNAGYYESGYSRGGYQQRQPSYAAAPRRDPAPFVTDPGMPSPAVSEMLAAGDCADGTGVLEMHPDGYGFLRSDTFLPSSKDIYVSMAQIRRFGLRTGDRVTGKTRPQRDGDKYAAMLYITDVNGVPADELDNRASFDELTPIYPTRRIDLDCHGGEKLDDMRLVDLMAPLGFGQRALVLCPPDTGKTALLQDFARVIRANHPEAEVMVLLINEAPEEVTLFREAVDCRVLASTFDQPPENHLRITDLVLERAQRLVEQGKDVVLIVDSLTRLARTYTTTAAQQGRSVPGMVNPTSLFRAKRLFGAARFVKEGGSLTIIAAMDIETGVKADDTIVEEFKGTANMELVLDQAVAKAGVHPAFNLSRCSTKRAELLLTPEQLEGVHLTRKILGSTHSATAIPQLLEMMDKVDSNATFLARIKDWAALMEKSR